MTTTHRIHHGILGSCLLCASFLPVACGNDTPSNPRQGIGGSGTSGANGAGSTSTPEHTAVAAQGGAIGAQVGSGGDNPQGSSASGKAPSSSPVSAEGGGAVSQGGAMSAASGIGGTKSGLSAASSASVPLPSGGASATATPMATGGSTSASISPTPVGGGMPSSQGRTSMGGRAVAGGTSAAGSSRGGAAGAGSTTTAGGSTAAVPSSGCGRKDPPASARHTIAVSAATREYVLKLPDGYDPNHPYRLFFGWHGAKYDADWVANGEAPLTGPYFGLESEANGSAIFVAPQALSGGWTTDDLAFVDAMLARLEEALCIDKSRIFSVGFSMGAIMTITIGCNRSDVFRGIAPMSGSLPSSCPNGTHVAYWASHGTDDTTISPARGEAARDEFVKRNHCTSQSTATDRSGCVAYQGCDQGYPVTWCTFKGVHEPAPFAGPAIWQFLSPL